jgi:hypothetical protein
MLEKLKYLRFSFDLLPIPFWQTRVSGKQHNLRLFFPNSGICVARQVTVAIRWSPLLTVAFVAWKSVNGLRWFGFKLS